MKYKIIYDRESCIGAASCVVLSKNWVMNDKDGKADVIKTDVTEEQLTDEMEAAESCPVNCIHIEDEKGKRLI